MLVLHCAICPLCFIRLRAGRIIYILFTLGLHTYFTSYFVNMLILPVCNQLFKRRIIFSGPSNKKKVGCRWKNSWTNHWTGCEMDSSNGRGSCRMKDPGSVTDVLKDPDYITKLLDTPPMTEFLSLIWQCVALRYRKAKSPLRDSFINRFLLMAVRRFWEVSQKLCSDHGFDWQSLQHKRSPDIKRRWLT